MKIYAGNLSFDVTEDDLRTEFSAFGKVDSVAIIKDRFSGESKGFAFIEMPTISEGQAAINGLNGKTVKERVITVNAARTRPDDRGGFRRGGPGGQRRGGGGGGGRGGGFNRGGRGGGQRRY